jgi:hypothetical protein
MKTGTEETMALIHTIKINEEKSSRSTVSSTRKSDSRRYEACLVVTTTKRSLEIDAAAKADTKKKLAETKAEVERLSAQYGMTVEEADAEHEARSEAWYGKSHWVDDPDSGGKRQVIESEGLFDIERRLRAETAAALGIQTYRVNQAEIERQAKAELKARGLVDPFDDNTSYALHIAGHEAKGLEYRLEHWPELKEGSQAVISWHTTVDNARKAAASPSKVEHWTKRGDTVEVRTDIEVRETKKRTKKSA